MSNSLDPVQDQHSVSPDLGPNCLQRLSADDKIAASKESDNKLTFFPKIFLFIVRIHTYLEVNLESYQILSGP